jgi:alpha/beta hydrolase family protein
MTERNFSPSKMFTEYAKNFKPAYTFTGKDKQYFEDWKKNALPEVLDTLGEFPPGAELNPTLIAEWEHDGLIKQRWFIDVAESISAVLLINRPKDLDMNKKNPAILCCHGHGQFGKEPVMGNDSSDLLKADIKNMNYNYGHQMAKAGFVTYSIDWIGFGERNDSQRPNSQNTNHGRDWCNLYYLNATMLGMTSLSINVAHGKAATDFVSALDYVDSDNLGVMGLSGGGTMSLWMSLCDERFKATEIICYSNMWQDFGFRDYNYCGMQVAPKLYRLVDLPELQGLLAPHPLLIDIGAYDTCFKVDSAMECYKSLENIYNTAGASEKLGLDFSPTEHAWGGNKSVDFFNKYLK